MAKKNEFEVKAPWNAPTATKWLESFDAWKQMLRLVNGTLRLEVRDHPQEIRAATSMVVLFCRENLWPIQGKESLEPILELAARQLSSLKQLYETKSRTNSDLLSNSKYRDLLSSIDQEIRILEARMTTPKPKMPNKPPVTWGDYWTD